MEFKKFKEKLQSHFKEMTKSSEMLFLTDVSKDDLYDTYLNSIPEDVRQEYNCNSCRQFIKWYGNLVSINGDNLISIWDFDAEYPFVDVAKNLSSLVKSKPIRDISVIKFKSIGTDFNNQVVTNSVTSKIDTIRWEHLFLNIPVNLINKSKDSEESIMGVARDTRNVFRRALDEISIDSMNVVLEIISQGSLYRGDQYKSSIESFKKLKGSYMKLPDPLKEIFCWKYFKSVGESVSKIRNTSIGTLLIDITNGVDLDQAVTSFEKKMAPENYKRPKALVTKSMIDAAEKKVSELGLENSLGRVHASIDDITVNNVIYADRNSKKSASLGVFDALKENLPDNPKKFSKATEISIDDFIKNVIPTSTSVEILFEDRHFGNLMTLTAPADKSSPSLFKWNNGFSWSYKGDAADSFIKQKIKSAGGNVVGELRCSLHWFNFDDLDIHVIEPNGNEICFHNKRSVTSGYLDIDMNAGGGSSRDAVENIIWTDKSKMLEGTYKLIINNYCLRETTDIGFETEIECNGITHKFDYDKLVKDKENVLVAEFKYTKSGGVEIIKSLKDVGGSVKSIDEWSIGTNKFQKVSLIMLSPNYWDGQGIGNKHYFFIIEGCKNPESVRGFYNEFLKDDLMSQKRVFEVLGSKMKIDYSDNQLSGLGFSSTIRNSIICRVKGATERILKINF